jgi:hypothetical protein
LRGDKLQFQQAARRVGHELIRRGPQGSARAGVCRAAGHGRFRGAGNECPWAQPAPR